MEKHKAIIFGRKVRLLYDTYYNDEIRSYHSFIEKVVIFEGDIDNPPLEEKEFVFIPELEKSVEIKSRARNLDGGYVYVVDYITEKVSDEESEKSKKEAEEKLAKIVQERKEKEEAKKLEEDKNNKWYRRLFKTNY